ncbi:MAG TPA: hypothetical protein VL137_03350 [Polyangiaceae bacterium]|nr:hypothetical protein [Polyangiaceae bacterium]
MKRSLTVSLVAPALTALALVCSSSIALAQTDTERAGARAAAQQGAQAFADGKFAEAADLFGRAESLVHAPPHLLYIARSYEKLGKLVEAREEYLKITKETLAATAPDAFRSAQADANNELAALEPRIPYLAVTIPAGATNVKVTLDGVEVPAALVGLETPVNPGKHTALGVFSGADGAPQEVDIVEGAHSKVEVAPAAAPAAAATAAATPASVQDQGTGSNKAKTLRIGSYVGFGVGVVGLTVGTVFLIKGAGKTSDANKAFDQCTPNCSTVDQHNIQSLDDDASSAKTVAVVGYVAGAVGIGAGVTLLILSNKASHDSAEAHITPWVGWQSAGVSGSF